MTQRSSRRCLGPIDPPGLSMSPLVILLVLAAGFGRVLTAPTPAGAQIQLVEEGQIPLSVREGIVGILNEPATLLFDGGGRIPAGEAVAGDVASLGGPLRLGGMVEGDLLVVNGDLVIETAASVGGEVIVVGGGVEIEGSLQVQGSVTVYEQRLRYARDGGRIVLVEPIRQSEDRFAPSLGFGRARVTVRAGTNYNRIEGLPVMFGPIIETSSSNPLRLDAFAVWRSESGFNLDPDEMGYQVGIEQFLGGREIFSVGATALSLVEPIERWALGDLEASLATFLFHRDYRDYYEREGWNAFFRVRSPTFPLTLTLEYGEEEHDFLAPGSPWSLVDNEDPWRPQPLVAEGLLRTFGATAVFDTRNDREEPTHGWWIETGTTVGLGGSLRIPESFVDVPDDPDSGQPARIETVAAQPVDEEFAAGFVDARRYNRVGPTSELILRTVLGGSLTRDPLPPQFQHALGGEGNLPGFPLFSVDCGARRVLHDFAHDDEGGETEPAFPFYGCDRMALFQAEFRMDLPWTLNLGDGERSDLGTGLDLRPRWGAFLDAGRGWALSGQDSENRFDEETRLDVGLGLLFNDAGLYVAFPLTGDDRQANLFLRVQQRF